MNFFALSLTLLFFSFGLNADPAKDHEAGSNGSVSKAEAEARKFAYLYDVVTKKTTKATGALKPGRIYLRWEPSENSWVYDFPDKKGFKNPPQFFLKNSVVRGDMFGLSKDKKFRLNSGGPPLERWVEVHGAVEFYMLEPGSPPHKLTYEDPETEYINF